MITNMLEYKMTPEDKEYIQSLIDYDTEVIERSGWMLFGRMMPPTNKFIRRTRAITRKEIDRVRAGIPVGEASNQKVEVLQRGVIWLPMQ